MKKFFSIVLLIFLVCLLCSCEGYTWKYHTTIQYHYEGEDIIHTTEHDVSFGYSSLVEEISVRVYANSFNNGHDVELVYCVQHGDVIQENSLCDSYYKYCIMQVPDKSVLIDNVKTVRTSKIK